MVPRRVQESQSLRPSQRWAKTGEPTMHGKMRQSRKTLQKTKTFRELGVRPMDTGMEDC